MSKINRIKIAVIGIFIVAGVAVLLTNNIASQTAYAFSSGPPAGHTGAPGEFTCAECHVPPDAGTGKLMIDAPQSYVPGQTYLITVSQSNSDPTRQRWGFQLTALDDTNMRAGNLEPVNNTTQVVNDQGPNNNRQYVQHNSSGTFAGQPGKASWVFQWTAPPSDVGPVMFYAAGNQANGDGNSSGDFIYFTFITASVAAGASSVVHFGATSYSVSEGAGSAIITVTRSGATTGGLAAATVDFTVSGGTASARADYHAAGGTLQFAPGETMKTFDLFITDDSYVEAAETIDLTLVNAGGVTLGEPARAVLNIIDNDAAAGTTTPPNPIDDPRFFVRQHYIDILNRAPDAAGYAGWLAKLEQCPAAERDNPASVFDCTRSDVSAAFFRSDEFQLKGYYLLRFYHVALGRRPSYAEFVADMGLMTGLTDQEFTAKREAFPAAFTQRAEFKQRYDALSNADYLTKLAETAGVVPLPNGTQLAGDLNGGRKSRAEVLRAIVESEEVYRKYYNEAFVAMEYFGYLKRDPDEAGFTGWVNYLNRTGDYRTMVWGFIYSPEYKLRFGPVAGF